MNRDELLALADRCEAAAEPDRELDCAISLALVVPPDGCKAVASELSSQAGLLVDRIGRLHGTVDYQPLTASLDAAMSLAPNAPTGLEVSNFYGNPWRAVIYPEGDGTISEGLAATPALALTAAALRARVQALEPSK